MRWKHLIYMPVKQRLHLKTENLFSCKIPRQIQHYLENILLLNKTWDKKCPFLPFSAKWWVKRWRERRCAQDWGHFISILIRQYDSRNCVLGHASSLLVKWEREYWIWMCLFKTIISSTNNQKQFQSSSTIVLCGNCGSYPKMKAIIENLWG